MTYNEFIGDILNTRGRFACGDEYCERHHIVPRCMGGKDSDDNLIDLYAREHFIAHKLLARENPENEKLVYAWNMMATTKGRGQQRYKITPEEYEEVKVAFSKTHSNVQKSNWENEDRRRQQSETLKVVWEDDERRKRQSEIRRGTHHTEETKSKISKSNKGREFSETHIENLSKAHKGKPLSKETRQKMSEAKKGKRCGKESPLYGKHHSEESKKKMSEKRIGENNPSARKVVRLLDLNVYGCIAYAASDNNMCENTMRSRCKKHNDFMYYDEYLTRQNDLENNIC